MTSEAREGGVALTEIARLTAALAEHVAGLAEVGGFSISAQHCRNICDELRRIVNELSPPPRQEPQRAMLLSRPPHV